MSAPVIDYESLPRLARFGKRLEPTTGAKAVGGDRKATLDGWAVVAEPIYDWPPDIRNAIAELIGAN